MDEEIPVKVIQTSLDGQKTDENVTSDGNVKKRLLPRCGNTNIILIHMCAINTFVPLCVMYRRVI